ncbi:MAG TPA: hypothetical protein VGB07_13665, partial [Blastocatellia bacterium]
TSTNSHWISSSSYTNSRKIFHVRLNLLQFAKTNQVIFDLVIFCARSWQVAFRSSKPLPPEQFQESRFEQAIHLHQLQSSRRTIQRSLEQAASRATT